MRIQPTSTTFPHRTRGGRALSAALGVLIWVLVWILTGIADPRSSAADTRPPVDINIVVSLDRSDSISPQEAQAQLHGIAYTLGHDRFARVVDSGLHGRIGLAIVAWSSFGRRVEILPWTLIDGPAAALATAAAIVARTPAAVGTRHRPQTDIALGIRTGTEYLDRAPFQAAQGVINIVSDGIDNFGIVPHVPRRDALRRGYTINALTMGRGSAVAALRRFYQRDVIGGPRAFVHNVLAPDEMLEGTLRKMLTEVALLNRPMDAPLVAPTAAAHADLFDAGGGGVGWATPPWTGATGLPAH